MDDAEHKDFSRRRKVLEEAKRSFGVLADTLKETEVALVQGDNKISALESQIIAKKASIGELDEKIRMKELQVSSSNQAVRDDMDRKNLELIEREAKMRARELAMSQKETRMNDLLNKAERVTKADIAPAAPVIVASEPVGAVVPVIAPVRAKPGPKPKVKVPA